MPLMNLVFVVYLSKSFELMIDSKKIYYSVLAIKFDAINL